MESNLTNSFIRAFKSFTIILILFVFKKNGIFDCIMTIEVLTT